ncbi:PQQ-binding-like beta-propeller repeat protein, partial [Candidatus Pacearchaeota archaeon]|nr:PQQ-binding-like beta-propeller repeat protein [Candidatus Pacearchaeota archaeon]
MAYKKYIKRGGKLYGPYIYESKREGDKVVSVYKGTIASEKNKIKKNFAPAIVIFSLIILAMLFIFINLPHPTGKITLQVSPAYNQGEAISGALKLSLKAGELIPASSVISADLNGEKRQFLLSELLTQGAAEGSFYIENAQLSGSGAGYGIAGTKTIYPEIQFKLKTIKERAKDEQQMPEPAPQQNPPQTEQPSETPSSPIEQPQIPQETSTEQPLGTTPELPAEEKPIEQPKQEQKAEEKETKNEEKQAEQEQKQEAKEEKSGITGEVVSEKEEKMIDVVVSANQPFSYAIEEGESAEIVQGSVRLAGEKDKKIDESALNLQIQASKITITTSYSETETGFGADFTGGEAKTIEISLEKLDITAQEGSLQVALSYNGAEIISASADVDIGYKAPDIPQEEPKEIPVEQPGEEISEIPTIPEENLTNATAPKVNVTIPENITELNITGQNITNATLQNVTELNITELNITEINITELNLSLIRNIPDITLEKNSNTTLNLSEYFAGAEGYKAVQPENISISIDLENALIVPEANFTGIRNASITAYRENESIQEDFVINVQETNITIQTIQYQAKIGHPVKWKKIITTENPENITLKLPANSTNITLKEIKDSRIIEESQINTITGQAVSGKISVELSLKKEPKFITFLKKLFRLKGATGRAVEAEETKQARQEVEVNITAEENIEYELEYYTDAPYAIETKKGNYSKEIIVSSNIHYEDVLSYAFLPFEVSSEKAIKLKWKIFAWQNLTALNLTAQETEQLNNQSELVKEIGFDAYDTDNNTKIDYIEWIVPALSNQTYEISITILNVHSHPSLYGNWTVEFETSGQANLTITATQDLNYTNLTTRWSNESENETAFDLKFLEVRCGNETKQYEWLGENCSEQECSALITDYSCNVTAQEISRVLTPKLHVLKFNFGGQEAYAYNAVGNETSESDNNEWRMFRRYLNHTGFTNASDPIRIGTNITFYTTGAGGVYSSPAVANGFVYVGSNDAKLYQLNASNVSQMIASYSAGGSIYSSPAVGDNYVYVLNYDTNLYQLNASNVSKLIANFSTGGGLYNTQSSPAVFNGSVYVGSTNNMLYQLNATNVSQKIANFSTGEAIYTTPAVANSYVYFGSNDNQVYQLNASNVSQKVANFSTSGAVYSSPAISGGFVYVGSDDKNIYQLNASNVSQKVANFSTGGVVRSSPAVSGGFVYVGSDDNQVYQLNASNVSLLIANFSTRGAISFSSPALTSRFVYVGSNDSKLYQLNASNVSLFIASYSTSGAIESSPAISGGFVYVGSLDRNIYQLGGPDIVPPDIN